MGAGERTRSETLRTGVILTNIKFNSWELPPIRNNNKHKRATWEIYLLMFAIEKEERVMFGRHGTTQKAFTGEDAFLWCLGRRNNVCRGCDTTCNSFSILSTVLPLPTSAFRWKHKQLSVCRIVCLTLCSSGHIKEPQHNKQKASQSSKHVFRRHSVYAQYPPRHLFVRHLGKARELKHCNCPQDPPIPVGRLHRHIHGTTKHCMQETMKWKKNLWTFKK